ncbi:MAG: fatty-acid synthase [Okeania sp. SIO3B5]|uniref:element excision factor XisH family protein n=1 Tax=Okeania sp. SIO3B5 TaxID=2607811 RepID=UPI001400673A|nr:element excision factor XisH family protein [Okeania sp. SIO3B5]NEO53746.1 fatty-acid synthase [Okeania sp. SIO3B5]
MPARDAYHNNLINALVKDNWSITDDPYVIKWGSRDMFVDLGASLLLAAEKEEVKIAVELKSFAGRSPINDLENAVGQYIVYHDVLKKTNPERILYLAVDEEAYEGIFSEPIGKLMLENQRLNLVAFHKLEEVIIEWIPSVNINK